MQVPGKNRSCLHRRMMGTFRKDIEIGTPDASRYESYTALVDTGASMTTLPASSLRELGVEPHDQLTFALADGRRIQRDVGQTWIRIDGRAVITLVVFGDEEVQPLLGAYSLQGLMLAVDTPYERLVRTEALLMQQPACCLPSGCLQLL